MADDIALSVQGLYKDFLLPHERKISLKERIVHFSKPSYEHFHALKDINFEVKRGEFFGIVGRNGSGKSTLLKLIGGIYQPTKGSVNVNGTLTPFIELGIGFNPELTGRENIFLNGAILGLTRKEIKAKYEEVVAFAEIENFMDQKLKNYSSGMQVRLAFSIAIQAHNDILLIDEVLAVGDAAFQRKCYNVFKQIKKSGRTVVFVTHDMGAVQEYCDRAMMIEDSEMLTIGKPREVALRYEVANSQRVADGGKQSDRPTHPAVRLDGLHIRSDKPQKGDEPNRISQKDDMLVDVNFTVHEPTELQFNLFMVHPDGRYLAGVNTTVNLKNYKPNVGKHRITCKIEKGQFTKGDYLLNAALYTYCEWPSTESPELIDILDSSYGYQSPRITVEDISPMQNGEFNMEATWKETTHEP
jgi:ABC-2 type transport system ATP-binding protein